MRYLSCEQLSLTHLILIFTCISKKTTSELHLIFFSVSNELADEMLFYDKDKIDMKNVFSYIVSIVPSHLLRTIMFLK